MIEWFTIVQAVLALSGTAVALVAALRGRAASDSTVVPAVVGAGLLIVQILVAAVSPLWGNNPVSDPLEFWMYLITDAMMMPAAIVFALADISLRFVELPVRRGVRVEHPDEAATVGHHEERVGIEPQERQRLRRLQIHPRPALPDFEEPGLSRQDDADRHDRPWPRQRSRGGLDRTRQRRIRPP